ncbi:MAG TPA: hypothetical protein VLH85_02350 [Levilinea sp.]|nr:hypothetical protein [Levilinea sp.]
MSLYERVQAAVALRPPDGAFYTAWGTHRRLVDTQFSHYFEYASFPLAEAASGICLLRGCVRALIQAGAPDL